MLPSALVGFSNERKLNRLPRLGEDKPSPLLCFGAHGLAKAIHSRETLVVNIFQRGRWV